LYKATKVEFQEPEKTVVENSLEISWLRILVAIAATYKLFKDGIMIISQQNIIW
jgi:hypothetical protein